MQTIRNLLICQIITSIFAEDILRQIDVKTGDCEDCGMSQFGDISIKVTSIHHPKFTKNEFYPLFSFADLDLWRVA